MGVHRRFPPTHEGARAARRFVASFLAGQRVVAQLGDDACLLTSELVTNAALHARTAFTLGVELSDEKLRITVAEDPGPLPPVRPLLVSAEGGRGLALVAAVASSWGCAPEGDGKSVWFELRRSSRDGPNETLC
jgi:anti-sigma regulatory factor (Ser/Thr protein kinase)